MNEAGRKVEALLQTSLAFTWAISDPKGALRRCESGEHFNTQADCGSCGGSGKRGKHPCPNCNGTGTVLIDTTTRRTASDRIEQEHAARLVTCDSCGGGGAHGNGRRCDYCDGRGVRANTDHNTSHILARLEARERVRAGLEADRELADELATRRDLLHRQGSYADLDVAMRRLEHEKPVAHAIVVLFLVMGSPAARSDRVQRVLDATCELLAHWMPDPIRVPAWALERAAKGRGRWANGFTQAQRNREIRAAYAGGEPVGTLARRFALDRRSIQRIVKEAA